MFLQVKYLQDFAEGNGLNIRYHAEIVSIARRNHKSQTFLLKDQNGLLYQCGILIIR